MFWRIEIRIILYRYVRFLKSIIFCFVPILVCLMMVLLCLSFLKMSRTYLVLNRMFTLY